MDEKVLFLQLMTAITKKVMSLSDRMVEVEKALAETRGSKNDMGEDINKLISVLNGGVTFPKI